MAIVTLTTDFGTLYPASLKAVILGICPGMDIVDITHSVPHADIRAGAFAIYSVAEYFPEGTVHIAVVDPGVGTSRKAIVIVSGGQYFVGPDNGLMVPAAGKLGDPKVYEITNKDLLSTVSSTFHGRDIFARVGAFIAKGMAAGEVGGKIDDYIGLDISDAVIRDNCILAEVNYIDDFGNVITNIPHNLVHRKIMSGTVLQIADHCVPFLQTYGQVQVGDILCIIGSHGFFEIAVNQGSAAEILGLRNGDRVNIQITQNK
ncbi:MAG: S-adenosyl-l-methionine hydroxide adenosyltransferase family protein [Methanolobus sp.]|uniref:SAM hydrolase/SAM-dependent halogenase family protein n=1 Tax=Methanolobus sp. TaxID=1874737 RepID=UPI0027316F8E|nr:S-adenosyl-l-methionine hydroxide adenosyltransferase family protein [Methanolobus sp.]MDP2216220.1 S-adenosyl-l-methionine hydroxide adenosyltransferase family protein [Methanolobus sp.]